MQWQAVNSIVKIQLTFRVTVKVALLSIGPIQYKYKLVLIFKLQITNMFLKIKA